MSVNSGAANRFLCYLRSFFPPFSSDLVFCQQCSQSAIVIAIIEMLPTYFVSSEYFPVSGNDNLPCAVNSHLPFQFEKVFSTAIIYIHQICLFKRGIRKKSELYDSQLLSSLTFLYWEYFTLKQSSWFKNRRTHHFWDLSNYAPISIHLDYCITIVPEAALKNNCSYGTALKSPSPIFMFSIQTV